MQDDLDMSLKKATNPPRQQPVSSMLLSRQTFFFFKHAFNGIFLYMYCAPKCTIMIVFTVKVSVHLDFVFHFHCCVDCIILSRRA